MAYMSAFYYDRQPQAFTILDNLIVHRTPGKGTSAPPMSLAPSPSTPLSQHRPRRSARSPRFPATSWASCRRAAPRGWRPRRRRFDGFLKLNAIFENTTLEPLAREILIMTMATQERLPHLCRHPHQARLIALGADENLIAALRFVRTACRRAPRGRSACSRCGFSKPPVTWATKPCQAFLAHGYTQLERPRGRPRHRRVHAEHPGEPPHPRSPGPPVGRIRLGTPLLA